MNEKQGRRDFLQTTTLSAAGVAAGSLIGRSGVGYAANETIQVGLIGVGGRSRHLLASLVKIPNVKITAVCDIWDDHLEKAKEYAIPGAFATKDYHELLGRSDVDAVLIASPDHWHVPMTIDACAAGKDVYVEKPLTHNLAEGQAVIDAQNNHERIVQVGMQQRSMPHIAKAKEVLAAGTLGDIHKVDLSWNRNGAPSIRKDYGIKPDSVDWKRFLGNAPDQPFDAYAFRNWRWYWDFGGGIFTDLMVHFIDVAHWLLDLDHPDYAASVGDFFQNEGVWQTPDTVQTLLRYPEQKAQIHFEGTFFNARNRAQITFMGTEGSLYIDRGRYEIRPDHNKPDLKAEQYVLGTGGLGADFYDKPDGELLHLTNWLDCIRSRETPTAPAEAGVSAAGAAHLANIAMRSEQTARWGEV